MQAHYMQITQDIVPLAADTQLKTPSLLHWSLQGCSLQTCAAAGCTAGAEAVQSKGAELDDTARQRLSGAIAKLVEASAGSAACSNHQPLAVPDAKLGGQAAAVPPSVHVTNVADSAPWVCA